MDDQKSEKRAYGKSSYEYAIGCFKASSLQPLSAEQTARLRDSDLETAVKLLAEYGYPPVSGDKTVTDAIEEGMAASTAFIRENAPDSTLTDLLFFEEDALNLKIFLKAARSGSDASAFFMSEGCFSKEILRICAETGDFSLLGDDIGSSLEGIENITDPSRLSCAVDAAMFGHSLSAARKRGNRALVSLLEIYGQGKNRLTALRLNRLGMDVAEHRYAFLPVGNEADSDIYTADALKKDSDILNETASAFNSVIDDLSHDEGMGFIARYYFLKKNEAAALRLMFAEKTLSADDTAQ